MAKKKFKVARKAAPRLAASVEAPESPSGGDAPPYASEPRSAATSGASSASVKFGVLLAACAKAANFLVGPRSESLGPASRVPLFRRVDWVTFGVTTASTLLMYLITLAPDLTLQDSGELAVGSYYAGVPHAPGYPVWTIYTWFFTVLLPIANVAWRVAVSSAVAAAVANGLLGLVVSRGCSMILESIEDLREINRHWENELCFVSGFVAAMMFGFNGFMWSQAVIVEVYTLSVLSWMGVIVCLLHWTYAPQQRRYLFVAAFLFGICFNNHQTLIVAAIGIEVLIAFVHPRLGRDAFFFNSLFWLIGVICHIAGVLTTFTDNTSLWVIYNLVGIGSVAACGYLTWKTGSLLTEWRTCLIGFVVWLIGAAFYFYMPIAGSTNPPMNWGYPRTWDGFIHAFTRGQYERTNPTDIIGDPFRFLGQLNLYFMGTIDEFHLAVLLLAVVPFCFFTKMQPREKAWIIGNTAIYLCLAFFLLILLNPNPDRQSRELTKVFFTASHLTIAMFVGFGITLVGAMLLTHYRKIREWALLGAAVGTAVALYALAAKVQEHFSDPAAGITGLRAFFWGLGQVFANPYPTPPVHAILARLFMLVLSLVFLVVILLRRERVGTRFVLVAFAVIPLYSPLSHWAENEQRGHLFGYWFGHDMFSPPFDLYPPMTKDAILFGGTDPGRFAPTYMIFCESFIEPTRRRDPDFDRRDVYIITQNALADNTYLNYIRAHYHRSTQIDPPFFRDMWLHFQSAAMGKRALDLKAQGLYHRTNGLAGLFGAMTNVTAPLDRALLNVGRNVEERRRREGVYPPKEILMPTPEDLQTAYNEYIMDVTRRQLHDRQFPNESPQVRQGEIVTVGADGRAQVSGQVAVMAINALLTQVIFDRNPDHEFFLEESFALPWMYPHLTPFGIILKINREPVTALTPEVLARDHDFWTRYTERLCGNWITYDTSIDEICAFVERVYLRGNLRGFTGDPKFVRDDDAQKAFSKLRNAIASLYAWRLGDDCPEALRPKTEAERDMILREADFAFRQSYAICPYSPEALSRYVALLASVGRIDDAFKLANVSKRFDEEGSFTHTLAFQLERMKKGMSATQETNEQLTQLHQDFLAQSNDVRVAFDLVSAYLAGQRTNDAYQVLDQLVARPNADATMLLSVAQAYVQIDQYGRSELALLKLVDLLPDRPEVWYDLAGARAALGKPFEAVEALEVAIRLSDQRLATNSAATNLHALATRDVRFSPLRGRPDFQRLVAPK